MAKIVLVADDDVGIRKALCAMFERERDYDLCEQAKNGQEAIDLAMRCKPDLVILDFAMPVMGGIEAAKTIRRLMPNIPIILFTLHEGFLFKHLAPTDAFIDRIFSKMDMPQLMTLVRELAPV